MVVTNVGWLKCASHPAVCLAALSQTKIQPRCSCTTTHVLVVVLAEITELSLSCRATQLPGQCSGHSTLARYPLCWKNISLILWVSLEGNFRCCCTLYTSQEVLACSRAGSQCSHRHQPLPRWTWAGLMAQGLLQNHSPGLCAHRQVLLVGSRGSGRSGAACWEQRRCWCLILCYKSRWHVHI